MTRYGQYYMVGIYAKGGQLMSKLYGTITYDHHARQVTRTAHRYIETTAETWGAIVRVRLAANGQCEVTLTNKYGNNRRRLWAGNADIAAKERDGEHLAEARAEDAKEYIGSDGRIMKHCNTHRRIMTHVDGRCLACQEEAGS